LSREADAWIEQGEIEDVALPLYEGRMIGQFDFSDKGWVGGTGRAARWDNVDWTSKDIRPQYLMSQATYQEEVLARYLKQIKQERGERVCEQEELRLQDPERFREWWRDRSHRVSFMDITSATNARTLIAALCPLMPSGNKVPLLMPGRDRDGDLLLLLN
jgi:hypothetical protein